MTRVGIRPSLREDADFGVDYGFQSEWVEEETDKENLKLKATMALFDSISLYAGQEESIERFCLPLFAKANSTYAVEHVLSVFKKRPAMTQIYVTYLANFLNSENVHSFLKALLKDSYLVDWQRMWVVAALSQTKSAADSVVKAVLDLLKDPQRADTLRAVSAVFVGRFGDHARRKQLIALYPAASTYVQAAIYYSSRFWPKAERSNAKGSWGGHGPLNKLLTVALGKN